jgi:peptide/nickel transport system substrate-binding protein
MRYPKEEIEKYRGSAGELENELISEWNDGTLTRLELLQRGTALGISLPLLGLIGGIPAAAAAPGRVGRAAAGTLRVSAAAPNASLEPPLLQSLEALAVSHIPGEQLVFADKNSVLRPRLATSWRPLRGARSWEFTIRQNVRYHDGTRLTVDDVVATFNRLLTKDSQALSSYKGVIAAGGVKKVDNRRVRFDLTAANGFFPYLLGQMTYQAIILPKTYQLPSDLSKPGEWTSKMNGTGPFMLRQNRGAAGISFVANPNYWGGRPSLDRVEYTFLEDQARVTALQSGQIDLNVQVSYQGAQQLQRANQNVIPLRTATHRYLHMNTKKAPFNDVRVRQAFALALNRPQIARGLWGTFAEVGNDSPMWPGYAFTDKSVPQRKQDLAKARALLRAAGKENLKVTLSCYRAFEMPDYAQRVSQALRQIGVDCSVKVYTGAQYFDGVSYGAAGKLAPWLGVDFGIVDYGHRAVPLTYLNAALKTGGVWNAARYSSKTFDRLVANFVAAPSVRDQKRGARAIQQHLLRETPVIYGYFYSFIAAASPKVKGYVPDGIAVVNLRGVRLT